MRPLETEAHTEQGYQKSDDPVDTIFLYRPIREGLREALPRVRRIRIRSGSRSGKQEKRGKRELSDANFILKKQRDFIRQIKQDAEPLRFGPDARYGLSIIQVDALHEAAQDNSELMQLCFDAGFSAGLAYSRDKAEQQEPDPERQRCFVSQKSDEEAGAGTGKRE